MDEKDEEERKERQKAIDKLKLELFHLACWTFAALLMSVIVWGHKTFLKALGVFLGLEGTVLLAFALSPPKSELFVNFPKGLLPKLEHCLLKVVNLGVPVTYNPIYFYAGLLFLAGSIVFTAICD